MPDIIALGECMVEFFSDRPLGTATTFQRAYGGDTLNCLIAAVRLGSSCGYITRVGDDSFGLALRRAWQEEGIDVSHAPLVPGFNGIYFISLVPGGEREFTYYRGGSAASTVCPDDIDRSYVASARIVHASGISQAISPTCRAAVKRLFEAARQAGVRVSFDPNFRAKLWSVEEAREAADEALPFVDILLPSVPEDSQALWGLDSPQAVAEHLRNRGIDIVAVKCGTDGAVVADTATGIVEISAFTPDAPIIDTTGAGDAFNGAFLHGLCAGMPPTDAARLGVVTAGLKCRGRGAVASLPTREEVYGALGRPPPL
ncbi:hypothetical protein AMK68_00725 [candidate division KD3-62 bacterium DG_56]|uniref:Carbohydrate kinase PfkB domain-containing protein n=1 Tax=candidate division KD3-62 bacterium DG_56 TaxID=1704032 RepID=A0A0S7XQG3_9BACT|nr:MAG: hypothetical protein AMK68_00725 [candidate division KD3-62 bacterium DG_56]